MVASSQIVTLDSGALRVARMKRNVLTTARLLADLPPQVPGRPDRTAMITATYEDDQEWQPRDITHLVRSARRFVERAGFRFSFLWVLELTKRGRPHYHMALRLPATLRLPKPDDAGWWTRGMTRIEYARAPVAYMAKYLSKLDALDHYPPGARISGFGGLPEEARRERRLWASPRYVRDLLGQEANPFRAPGGGWLDRETGEVLPSRYQLVTRSRRQVQLLDRWGGADRPPGWDGEPVTASDSVAE